MTADIRTLWRAAQAVCCDVDSTVSPDEGIDMLAAVAGQGEAIATLTRNAMGGSVPFDVALRQRLDLLRPSRQLIAETLRQHPPRLTPGIVELVAALHARGTPVYLISGGFEPMILPLAERLGIAATRVYANAIIFAADGSYAGYDAQRPTALRGGKAHVIAALKQQHGYAPLIMIGDGATDLEARPPADGFIGYGGIVERAAVRTGADWFVHDFAVLTAALRE